MVADISPDDLQQANSSRLVPAWSSYSKGSLVVLQSNLSPLMMITLPRTPPPSTKSHLAIERTKVFGTATATWSDLDDGVKTLALLFQTHFTKAGKERHCQLTAQTASYHGAHASSTATPLLVTSPSPPPAALTDPYECTLYYAGRMAWIQPS